MQRRLQAAAELIESKLMIDTCKIERLTRSGTFNASTLAENDATTSTVYSGACQYNSPPASAQGDLEAIGINQTQSTIRVIVPISASEIKTGDKITVTGASLFPELVGSFGVATIGSRTSVSTVREVFAELDSRYP